MKKIYIGIAKFILREKLAPASLARRARYGILEGWISVLANLILFAVKIVVGLRIHSTALIGDAIHTLADSATSVVVIVGFKLSQKPSDREHPFGHGRVEPVATLIIAVLLFVAGFEVLHHSISSIMKPVACAAGYGTIAIIGATVLVKELLAGFSSAIGDYINSDALKADALHHRSDVLATLMVIAAMVAARYGYGSVDGIMGCVVSLVIFHSAFVIASNAISPLLGEAPPPDLVGKIEKLCRSTPGVLGVHDIIIHQYGQNRITSLHIEGNHKQSAMELHLLAEKVEDAVSDLTGGFVTAHIDPVNRNHPGYGAISEIIESAIKDDDRIVSFHDLRIVGEDIDTASIFFEINTSDTVPETDNHDIITGLAKKIKSARPGIWIRINVTPKFSY